MNILVTGGAGFLGSHLCDFLLLNGHTVFCLDNFSTGNRNNIKHLLNHTRFNLIVHDVVDSFDFSALESIFSQKDYFKNNGGDCLNLVSKAKICHSKRVFGKKRFIKRFLNNEDIQNAFDLVKKHQGPKVDNIPFGMYL